VALGTPVDVQISCDEQVNIAVRCAVGDETFGGSIEPPPPDDVPSAFDIEEIDRSFEAALAGLGSELAVAQQLRATYDEARSDVDEARRAADHPKLIQRVATLGGLVREARLAQPLEPPLAVVEESVAACLDLLPEATSAKPDLSVETLTAALEEILARAKAAYEARARQTYDEALQAVFSLRQFLTAVCRVQAAETTDVDLAVQAAMEVDQLRQLLLLLVFQAHISGQEELLVQLEGPLREVDELADGVEADPLDTIHRCRVHMTELRRILQQLSPDEAIGADLEGLVKLGEYADLADQGALSRSLDR